MLKKAIFGGSFDPPTNAHLSLGKELSKRFDKVIVVPAYISPFKRGGAELDGNRRFGLLKELFRGCENVTVSDVELAAKGTSYSYMTAESFAESDEKLYFVIGSDGLDSLDKWARPDILAKTVIFYVVERPYFPIRKEILDKARKLYRIEVAPFTGEEGSSSLLRVAVAFGKENEVVPPSVAEFIGQNSLYRDYVYITSRYEEFGLKPSRIEHVYRTAKAAVILAKLNGADTDKAIKAALLHDISKNMTDEALQKAGIYASDEIISLPESCRHQLTGALAAEKFFAESDADVLAAIATHTTGAREMSVLQKIIFAADYIEEGRSFDGLDEIRKLVYADLDRGVAAIMENTIKYLKANNMEIASATVDAYDYLRSKT